MDVEGLNVRLFQMVRLGCVPTDPSKLYTF